MIVSAPWILLGLIRDSSFAGSRRYVIWNILGIVDLVVAVSMGTICSGFLPGITGNVTTSAMAQLPLVLIPYGSPLYHVAFHGSFPSATIRSLSEIHARLRHLNQPVGHGGCICCF